MIRHKGQRERTGKSNKGRKLSGKEIDHRNGEDPSDQRNNPQIPFWFFKWVEKMGENKKKGRMKEGWVSFIEFYLAFEIVS